MIREDKLKNGTLTLGSFDFATQAQNVSIAPAHKEDGDPLETLSGDQLTPDTVRSNMLKITAIQDFSDPAGFVAYSWDNDLDTVAFVWKPQGATGPTYSGNVQVRAVEVGGEVNKRLTTEAEWPCEGPVLPTAAA